jgi:DNA invertase Pin-like site-specific DNA recombinase
MNKNITTQSLSAAARATRASRVVRKAAVDSIDHYVVRHLVVIRESAKKAARGIVGMTEFALVGQQTLDRQEVRNLPGASVLRPILDDIIANNAEGRALRESMNAITIVDNDNPKIVVGYFIKFEDVGYFLCVISATKPIVKVENNLVDMTNTFTVALARLITRYRVEHLHAGRFDRLVRNTLVATDLQTALVANKTFVHTSGGTLNMTEKNDQSMFTFQAAMAEASVKSVVGTLTNGWHGRAEAGKWPFAESALPALGYRLVSEHDTTIIPDLNQLELVRDLITWAADENMTLTDIATKLAEIHGCGSATLRMRLNNPKATILDSRYPETAVLGLLRNGLPMWLDGTYPLTVRIPHIVGKKDLREKVQEIVEDKDANGVEYAQPIATFNLPLNHQQLPGGKWANRKTIEAAIRLRIIEAAPKSRGRAATTGDRKPLAGIAEWIDGSTQYRLSARHKDTYRIIARNAKKAVDANGNRRGWSDREEDDIRAVIRPSELHQALAAAVADQLGTTQYTRVMTGARTIDEQVVADSERLDKLETELATYEKRERAARFDYEAARDLAIDKPTEANRNAVGEFLVARNEAQAEVAALAKRIAAAKTLGETGRNIAPGARISVERLMVAMQELSATEDKASPVLNAALRDLLVDMRCKLTDDNLRVIVETKLHLGTTDGPIVVGPIVAEVPNRRGGMRAARKDAMFERVFRDGMSFDEAAADCGYTNTHEALRFLRDWMVKANVIPSKGLRSAAVDCPIREAKLVIYEMHEAAREGRAFRTPKGVDPAYAEHVRATYADNTTWGGNWHSGNPTPSRVIVSQVVARNP